LKDRVEKGNLMDNPKDDIARKKLFDFLIENANIVNSEEINFVDLREGNY
jgi:hypothetical protein